MIRSRSAFALLSVTTATALLSAASAFAADWNPAEINKESTLEFRTVNAEGEDHWSTVWHVVLDNQVYVNLGERAVNRLKENTTAPYTSIRVDDDEFGKILVEPAQDKQPEVAQAIADKYWTGFLVPYRAPSTVMRLRPE